MSNPSQQAPQELPVAPALQQVAPAPPISGAPAPQVNEPPVPQVNIPHMGTSQATVPQAQAQAQPQVQPQVQAQPLAQAQPQAQAVLHMPPLPEGVSQEDVDTAIAHVEQTGHADGIAPQILAAACQQIEARANHQGINLQQAGQAPQEQQAGQAPQEQQAGPANYVEAAVMDKKGTFENFHNQRDSLRSAVTEQRESAQRTYSDALDKSNNPTGDDATGQANEEAMKALAAELKALDPQTIALINAMGVLSNTPEVMKSILWMEIVRAMRNLISSETKQQVKACMGDDAAA